MDNIGRGQRVCPFHGRCPLFGVSFIGDSPVHTWRASVRAECGRRGVKLRRGRENGCFHQLPRATVQSPEPCREEVDVGAPETSKANLSGDDFLAGALTRGTQRNGGASDKRCSVPWPDFHSTFSLKRFLANRWVWTPAKSASVAGIHG